MIRGKGVESNRGVRGWTCIFLTYFRHLHVRLKVGSGHSVFGVCLSRYIGGYHDLCTSPSIRDVSMPQFSRLVQMSG
jgi:hypothetical protein